MNAWRNTGIVVGGLSLLFVLSAQVLVPSYLKTSYSSELAQGGNVPAAFVPEEPPVVHLPTPTPMKALYMTACVASTPSWRASLKNLIDQTELNAVVIDIKDATGTVSFPSQVPNANRGKGCVASDLKKFISELHANGIYVAGRVSVFQDPSYSLLHPELAVRSKATGGVWRDRKGLSFIDVGAKPYWDYIAAISKEAYEIGFDELNYDYVRYPSDGDMADAHFTWLSASSTKAATLENFFSSLTTKMREETEAALSADLFGMTTTVQGDMGIGQVLERALPYFDFVAPMVYPSHYPPTWSGFANPAEFPYEVIKIAMSEGKRREELWKIGAGIATSTPSKLRPWLQDFHLGANYTPEKVRAQIQATYDSGLDSWMVWSAANKYTREALLPK